MARTIGTDTILAAAAAWRDKCLLASTSVFSGEELWTPETLSELDEHFSRNLDDSDRTFLEKLHDQLAPTSPFAKKLMAEMLWVMFLFPNNITRGKKAQVVTTVWGWSGDVLSANHPLIAVLVNGIGSAGMGYNSYRYLESAFLIRLMQKWKLFPPEEQRRLAGDPWLFGEFVDGVDGADKRQLRHMLLHLLFPDTFERVSSGGNKNLIDTAFADDLPLKELTQAETENTMLARDRRLLRIRRLLEASRPGEALDFYVGDLHDRWKADDGSIPAPVLPNRVSGPESTYKAIDPISDTTEQDDGPVNVSLAQILDAIRAVELKLDDRTIRRYHLALQSRGFVILSGVSGSGKTWLAQAYARAINAVSLTVPVAPNWTTNEDLLGYTDPIHGQYRDTDFSRFLREAATNHSRSEKLGRPSREYHLILDEMNLARVEYYFARFLSVMETRMRDGTASIGLGDNDSVRLPPNLKFIGTVNVDETTHGFADKVYDRAQLIEITPSRSEIESYLAHAPYKEVILSIWDTLVDVAPFAFRVLADIQRYLEKAKPLGIGWEELIDEQVLQKILPKIRGTDPRVGEALATLAVLATAQKWTLSLEKLRSMKSRFEQHGVASFF